MPPHASCRPDNSPWLHLLLNSLILYSLTSSLGPLATVAAAEAPLPCPDLPPVHLPVIPNRSVSVTDFGAVPDGRTLNTEAIAKAISALSQKGGGRLVFPPGVWLTGPIGLKNKIELHLDAGALVQFTSDLAEFPARQVDVRGQTLHLTTSPLWGEHLEDVSITGPGVFDGAGQAWRPVKRSKMSPGQWQRLLASGGQVTTNNDSIWYPSAQARRRPRPTLLKLIECRRVLLEGPTFQNSPGWNLNPLLCQDVTIQNVNVLNAWYAQNGDGLDLDHCWNVVVRNSRFDVGDDAICLKSGRDEPGRRMGQPTENILIQDCIVYHGHGGVTIGSEMSAGVRNVVVNNCLFLGTDVGLRFKSTRGRGGVVEKIFINNVRMTEIATDAIGFDMYYGGQAPTDENDEVAKASPKTVPVSEATPQFRDIYIQDVICRGAKQAVMLQGLPEMPIRGIHLRDVSISAERGFSAADARDITLERVEILNREGAVVSLLGSKNFTINGLTYPDKALAVFKAQGSGNGGILVKNTKLRGTGQDFQLSSGAAKDAFRVE